MLGAVYRNKILHMRAFGIAQQCVAAKARRAAARAGSLKRVPKARASFDATIASTELATLESDAFSSGLLKQHRVSPDGMLQMAF